MPHDHQQSIKVLIHVPDHAPRAEDPHYKAFDQLRRRMKEQGLLKCVVCGDDGSKSGHPIELHHSFVEFSMQNAVDVHKLNEVLGLHLSDEEFKDWVNSPGDVEALCVLHHRSAEGVHILPEPIWNIVRVARDDFGPVAEAHGNV